MPFLPLTTLSGTSMRVSPACNLPESSYHNGGYLIICNLQRTPYDKYAKLVIRTETDNLMIMLMEELGLDIPCPPTKEEFWLNEP
jgi:NAD-dependent SIR2 family protein deacetylase